MKSAACGRGCRRRTPLRLRHTVVENLRKCSTCAGCHPRRPETGSIQTVSRILEVVGITAKERDRRLGSPHQPHVGVFLIAVEVIPGAAVQRDHVAAQAGFVQRLLFDLRHHGSPRLKRFGRRHLGLTAASTRSVTSSIDTSWFNSRSGAGTSSSSDAARNPS